jgi:hypothetical protein
LWRLVVVVVVEQTPLTEKQVVAVVVLGHIPPPQ